MRVLLTSEARFERTPDGAIWGGAAYGRALWRRYLDVFSAVVVAARVTDVREPMSGSEPSSSSGVGFCALPAYSGLGGFVHSVRPVHAAVAQAVRACPALIVRAPSPIGYVASRIATGIGRPYGAEIVGDPDQVFSTGAFRHPLREPVRRLATIAQQQLSRGASAAIFVTQHALQRKYPTGGLAYAASDVALDDAAFETAGSRAHRGSDPFTIVAVGALDQPYKGTAILLDALCELRRTTGIVVRARIVGDGRLMAGLQARARALGIASEVDFLGQLDRAGVRNALDGAQLFVMPSLTEGLPRALLEAMARGLPAVATHVGGVPELLPADCLVPPRDARALAERIRWLLGDAAERESLGVRNRTAAFAYHVRHQAPVWRRFMLAVKEACTRAHQQPACA
jgi:glycosyltransferase involved in cell wall biosynthesis